MSDETSSPDPRIGFRLFDERRIDEAEDIFKSVILAGDNQGLGHYGMALIHISRKEPAKARSFLDATIRLDPTNANAYYYLGNIYLEIGDSARAEHFYKQVLNIDNTHIGARRKLGTIEPASNKVAQQVEPVLDMSFQHKEPAPVASSRNEVSGSDLYALLRNSKEPVVLEISQHLDTIANIIGTRRRRIRAFLSDFVWITIYFLIGLNLFPILVRAESGNGYYRLTNNLLFFALLAYIVIVTIRCLVIRSMKITVDHDILRIKTGVLGEGGNFINIFIASRHAKVSTYRSFFNRLTDDGAFILKSVAEHEKKETLLLHLSGFFSAAELELLSSAFNRISNLQPVDRDVQAATGLLTNIRSGTM